MPKPTRGRVRASNRRGIELDLGSRFHDVFKSSQVWHTFLRIIHADIARLLSPEGKCFTYDKRASGYGRGEGVACLVLKRADDAVRDLDPIRAVIRQTAINQDGRTRGMTLPNAKAQEELIRTAYTSANLDASITAYVEAHGTGTSIGDPIEAEAISLAFKSTCNPSQPLRIGSIKTNIGHTEGASGVAGIIKTILMLEKGVILPNVNLNVSNPRVGIAERNLIVSELIYHIE